MKRKILGIVLVLVMVLGLISCKSNTNDSKNENQTSLYPLHVTEFDNNVTIEKEPQRVVSGGPNLTEIICSLEAFDKLVGRTDYCNYPDVVSSVESIGSITEPDIEKIVSLNPDVVLVSTHFTDENQKKLEDLGIRVVNLYDQNDVNGVYDIITVMGKVLNKEQKAAITVEQMRAEIDGVQSLVKDEKKPSVYYVVGYGEYGDYTAGGDTFINGILELAGGDNIAKNVNGWSYSLEALLDKDPEYIFVGKGQKEDFIKAENYKELTAVKEDKVFEVDQNLFERQGPRNSQAVREAAKILHPEKF